MDAGIHRRCSTYPLLIEKSRLIAGSLTILGAASN